LCLGVALLLVWLWPIQRAVTARGWRHRRLKSSASTRGRCAHAAPFAVVVAAAFLRGLLAI